SFTFVANDGTVNSNTATVSLTVTPVNDAPVAADNVATTAQNTAVSGQLSAMDVDGDPLTYKKVSSPAHGTVTISATGAYTYTPSAGFSGTDSFTFAANDGTVDSNTAKITVTVTPAVVTNHAPVANAGPSRLLFTTTRQTAVVLDGSGSRDADGDPLTYRWSDWGTPIATGVKPTVTLGYGLHLITLTVTDPSGASSTGATLILLFKARVQ
ncbi:MAG: Ig-like domain-containing protein, partial [Armatimonadota bacterium]|nr:Ig-like domain-containing protein [Armatimonadota bacterium]